MGDWVGPACEVGVFAAAQRGWDAEDGEGGGFVNSYFGLRDFSSGEFAERLERVGVVGEGLADDGCGQLLVGK